MTIRVSLSSNLNDTTQWVGLVGDKDIPIVTNHASGGTSDEVELYIFDDGVTDSDLPIQFREIYFTPKGKRTRIISVTGSSIDDATIQVPVEDGSIYRQGTKIITDPIDGLQEEMWIRSIQGNNLVVDRGSNNSFRLEIPSGTWVEAIPDHIYLSLTGVEESYVNNLPVKIPDLVEQWTPEKVYLRVKTGALKTQVKEDTFFRITANEFPVI